MKVVIEIPDDTFEALRKYVIISGQRSGKTLMSVIFNAVRNGTPLPKGHGRIGDLDKIKKEMQNYRDYCAKTSEYTRLGLETAIAVVDEAPTIIEAESEGEE